jgi:hypothetical protein
LLFYILQKIAITDVAIFFLNVYYKITFQGLDIVVIYDEKLKCEGGTGSSGIMSVSSFVKAHVVSGT